MLAPFPEPADEESELLDALTRDGVSALLVQIAEYPLLDHATVCALARRARTGDVEARNTIVRHNLRLVVSIAKKYHSPGITLRDLFQEGALGLMRAADRFNPDLGHQFSTYATWWIRQAVSRAIADQGRVIRLPVHLGEALNRIRRATQQLSADLGRLPTPREIADATGLTEAKVRSVLTAAQTPVSLSLPLNEDGDLEMGDLIADDVDVLDDTLAHVSGQAVRAAVAQLPERERQILTHRYGLDGALPETLDAVGRRFGLTRERIRQIEAVALRKLRHPTLGRELRAFAGGED